MNNIKEDTNKKGLKAKTDRNMTANAAAKVDEAEDEDNTIVDPDAIQEAIRLEDDEKEYASSAQAEEEDALLKEFGF